MIHVVTPLGGKPVASHHLAIHVGRGGDKAVEAMVSWPDLRASSIEIAWTRNPFMGCFIANPFTANVEELIYDCLARS